MILWDPFGSTVGNAPPIFFGLAKENGPCTVQKKNAFRPNLPVQASLGMRTVESHDRIKPARSHPSALYLGNHPAFKPQVVTLPQIPGYLSKRLTSGPAAAPLGGVSKEGAAAPSLCRLKGWSRRGRPKSPSWRVFWTVHGPFSPRGENGGCIAQPSSWLSLPRPGMDAIEHPHCGPAATGGPNTASAGGHWPPWPGQRRHPPPGSTAPWPG